MPVIDTPLLVVGSGPAALVVAKLVSGHGLPSLVVGHEPLDRGEPVELDERSLGVLEPNGVLGVLRPYAATQDPFTIAPLRFEQGLKHHCVVDMLVTVYDEMAPRDLVEVDGCHSGSLIGTGGAKPWELRADAVFDAGPGTGSLNEAIAEAATFATELIAALH